MSHEAKPPLTIEKANQLAATLTDGNFSVEQNDVGIILYGPEPTDRVALKPSQLTRLDIVAAIVDLCMASQDKRR